MDLESFYRRYNALCNAHAFEGLGAFVAEDVIVNASPQGLRGYAQGLTVVVRAFPDYEWAVAHLVVQPPWIAAHLSNSGTHRGRFLDRAPTGRAVSTQEFAFYRVSDGKIAELHGTADNLSLLEQLV